MKTMSRKLMWGLWAVLITFVLGVIDWLSGYNLNFFVFYFFPVALAAYHNDLLGSVVLSFLCAIVWFGADILTGHIYPSNIHAVWNTLIRLISFLLIGWSFSSLKNALYREMESAEKLRKALSEVKVLKSFIPICAQCKKIRDEHGIWNNLEEYLSEHSNSQFSHTYCPECHRKALSEVGLLKK